MTSMYPAEALAKHASVFEQLAREGLKRAPNIALEINLARALMYQLRMGEARDVIRDTLKKYPQNKIALWCEAQLAFYLNHPWPGVWEKLEYRWPEEYRSGVPSFGGHVWDGSPLKGRTVLLAGEAGLGDELQFVRFATALQQAGGRVTVGTRRELLTLFSTMKGPERITCDPPIEQLVVPMWSAPWLLRTTPDTLPPVPQFSISDDMLAAQRTRIGDGTELNVGLVWTSSDRYKNVPMEILRPLWEIPRIKFFALGMKMEIQREIAGSPIVDLSSDTSDIIVTAAAMKSLDLVISVDTMAAHLAGSLARPVWLMLRRFPCWRWGIGGETTPWYPTMRLFREEEGGWAPVIDRIASELCKMEPRSASSRHETDKEQTEMASSAAPRLVIARRKPP